VTELRRLLDPSFLAYVMSGAVGRWGQAPQCPSCSERDAERVDRKGFHELRSCRGCRLLYRYPGEAADQHARFYQHDYESGMTTSLPSDAQLAAYLEAGFAGTPKDARRVVEALTMLGVGRGGRVLDFGASWGYTAWQLQAAGYDADAYEVSEPRADFATRLGVRVRTRTEELAGPYAAVYSGHVLEHVTDPAQIMRQQLRLLRPGGFLLAFTPNGSRPWRAQDFASFHRKWGRVHPVLLTDEFVRFVADGRPFLATSAPTAAVLGGWDQRGQHVDRVDGWELFFAIRQP